MFVLVLRFPRILLPFLRQVEHLLFPKEVNTDELAKNAQEVRIEIQVFKVRHQLSTLWEARYTVIDYVFLLHQFFVCK